MELRARKRNALKEALSPDTDSVSESPSLPEIKCKRRRVFRCLRGTFLVFLSLVIGLYTSSPFILRYSHFIQRELIYVNRIKIPMFANLSDPSQLGLPGTRHFFLQHESNGCRIGVWQILPKAYHKDTLTPNRGLDEYPSYLSDGRPIVLYLHGNTGTRATPHRVQLYRFLVGQKGYHVITFDYKGFGDSDCTPSEIGIMEDGLLVWNWIRNHAPTARVYLWGHSLGSSATTYLTSNLTASGASPDGILLDAPFTTIIDAASSHPFSLPFWPIMDLFRQISLQYLHETHPSIDRLANITCPIMIMHGHKDHVIPYHQGYRMYQVAMETRKPGNGKVTFIDCGNAGHKTNYLSEKVVEALDGFIQ